MKPLTGEVEKQTTFLTIKRTQKIPPNQQLFKLYEILMKALKTLKVKMLSFNLNLLNCPKKVNKEGWEIEPNNCCDQVFLSYDFS